MEELQLRLTGVTEDEIFGGRYVCIPDNRKDARNAAALLVIGMNTEAFETSDYLMCARVYDFIGFIISKSANFSVQMCWHALEVCREKLFSKLPHGWGEYLENLNRDIKENNFHSETDGSSSSEMGYYSDDDYY